MFVLVKNDADAGGVCDIIVSQSESRGCCKGGPSSYLEAEINPHS